MATGLLPWKRNELTKMVDLPDVVRIGARGSALARWQTHYVADLLRATYPRLKVEIFVLTTRGDKELDTPLPLIGGKGLFTSEIETSLRENHIDLAVHSLKDLPTSNPPGLTIGAFPRRAAVEDVLVSRGHHTLETLPKDATIGTSSYRRSAQLLHARPDLKYIDLRGNVDTRLRKALDPDGPYDAIALARAGLERLAQEQFISQILPLEIVLPAPGQGALAIQCRDEKVWLRLLEPLGHSGTRVAVTAERAFLAGLGGGCSVPVAAYGCIDQRLLVLKGRVCSPDGTRQVDIQLKGPAEEAEEIGWELAKSALKQGAAALLEATS